MNGISLAALLGAASWFGSKILGEDEADENAGAPDNGPVPAEPARELDARENELLWPSVPIFQ